MQSFADPRRRGGSTLILLDRGNDPKRTVLYISSLIFKIVLLNDSRMDLESVHESVESNLQTEISERTISFAIDFLFLIEKLDVDEEGQFYAL
ncbi:ABC-three component system middle component 6 [Weissella cibaria]|uniref:ABC-three component system middle component 6 n=1 Tax=Weissella cibaria TaxID=137591 RepID=UPI00352B6A3A